MRACGGKRAYRSAPIHAVCANRADGCYSGVGILSFRLVCGGGGMADALGSGASDRKGVEGQLLSPAPAPTTTRGVGTITNLPSPVGRSSSRKIGRAHG